MKAKASYKGIPVSQHSSVTVFRAARQAQGINQTPRQAWQELQAIAKQERAAKAKQRAEEKAQRKAKRAVLFNGEAAEELNRHAYRLAGVVDILRAIIAEGGEFGDAAGLARDAADEANSYISSLSDILR